MIKVAGHIHCLISNPRNSLYRCELVHIGALLFVSFKNGMPVRSDDLAGVVDCFTCCRNLSDSFVRYVSAISVHKMNNLKHIYLAQTIPTHVFFYECANLSNDVLR